MQKIDITEIQKDQARRLRAKGMGYTKLMAVTGISKGVANKLCKNIVPALEDKTLDERMEHGEACMYCGDPIAQPPGSGRRRRFCSTFCRREYWKIHRSELKQSPEAFHTMLCAYCGKTFEVYGRYNRKYCCHEHYLLHRNGAKVDNSEP
ncbi:MAG: RNA polymerase subunit sigma-70 [Oscillospiraceae bacterium]|nr:RNA polymerase subunit sigma-70 [Oscillospiraceae bacterium]